MQNDLEYFENTYLVRQNKDRFLPYYSVSDFEGLECIEQSFINSAGDEIHYFVYNRAQKADKETLLLLPGLGPGHAAYMRAISILCDRGYRVLTLDYTGCNMSGGERLCSFNRPTTDTIELLQHLRYKDHLTVIGHSLGGYTALNVAAFCDLVKKAVIVSGFLSIDRLGTAFFPGGDSKNAMKREATYLADYKIPDTVEYLKSTQNKLLFLHSTDDAIVPYVPNTGFVKENSHNPNLLFCIKSDRNHLPTYTKDACDYLTETLIDFAQLTTDAEKQQYMSTRSIDKMTTPDSEVWNLIFEFIEK